MDFDICSDRDFYYIPTKIDEELVKIIKSQLLEYETEESRIHLDGEQKIDEDRRKSKVAWVATDSWIAGVMHNLINCANEDFYHFDLSKWADKIQYTLYEGKNSHYSWHQDSALSIYDNKILFAESPSKEAEKWLANVSSQGKYFISRLSADLCYTVQQQAGGITVTDNTDIQELASTSYIEEVIGGARNIQLFIILRLLQV